MANIDPEPTTTDASEPNHAEGEFDRDYKKADSFKDPSASALVPKSAMFGCYVFLTKSMMGSGLLQLSSVCAEFGWFFGIGLCVFAALMTIVALVFNSQLATTRVRKSLSTQCPSTSAPTCVG